MIDALIWKAKKEAAHACRMRILTIPPRQARLDILVKKLPEDFILSLHFLPRMVKALNFWVAVDVNEICRRLCYPESFREIREAETCKAIKLKDPTLEVT